MPADKQELCCALTFVAMMAPLIKRHELKSLCNRKTSGAEPKKAKCQAMISTSSINQLESLELLALVEQSS